jgi:hypothetical protein
MTKMYIKKLIEFLVVQYGKLFATSYDEMIKWFHKEAETMPVFLIKFRKV